MASQRKAMLLEDQSNKYVYDTKKHIVHDRTCKEIEKISDDQFAVLKDLPSIRAKVCVEPCCYRRVMIRKGIPDYAPPVPMEYLINLMHDMHVTNRQLSVLTWEMGSDILYISPTKCILYVNKDAWKLELQPDGLIKLGHNSYRVNKIDMSRQMNRGYGGFHEQQHRGKTTLTFSQVFRIITTYSWDEHKEYLRQKDMKPSN